jgi:hypothetical protein
MAAPPKPKPAKVTLRLSDPDIQGILRAFSKMDKQANSQLRDLSKAIASDMASELRGSASGSPWYPRQASFVAQSVKVARDRVPSVTLGGNTQYSLSRGTRLPAGALLFLSEFGSLPSRQRDRFRNQAQRRAGSQGGLQGPPRSPKEGRGNRGYWIFPRLKRMQPDILRRWIEGAQQVADIWTKA